MTLDAIKEAARGYFPETMNPAHDWHHVQRVETTASRLLANNPRANDFVIRAAVFLHDIGRQREDAGEISDHAEWGAQKANQILGEMDVSRHQRTAIVHAVRAHRYSRSPAPETIEAKILSDADNLDALGAVGIARCFTHGGKRGSPIHDPALPPGADETSSGATQYNHFYKKLSDLPERMYTQTGRKIAANRWAYMEQFLERFDAEITGDR